MSERTVLHMSTEAERRFDAIFDEHHADIYRYCVRRLDRSEAEDAAADVFATAWRRIDDVPDGVRAKSWLIGVAYRTIGNRYRGKSRYGRLTAQVGGMREIGAEAAEGILRDEEGAAVMQALSRLSPSDQELLKLTSWDGLSLREIGEVLDIKENAVAQRLSRARRRLRTQFERLYGEPSPNAPKEASA